jgi:nucleotide-binding universal stress UspA family protein
MSVAVVPAIASLPRTDNAIPWVWRVLASTDFSELGNRAILHAYAALPQGGVLKLVHVVDPYALPDGTYVQGFKTHAMEKKHRELVASCLAKLRRLIPAEATGREIQTEVEVLRHSNPAEAIRDEAERFGADLVCLGTHGRSGITKTIFGSTAQSVMAQSLRPLLIVRPPRE